MEAGDLRAYAKKHGLPQAYVPAFMAAVTGSAGAATGPGSAQAVAVASCGGAAAAGPGAAAERGSSPPAEAGHHRIS